MEESEVLQVMCSVRMFQKVQNIFTLNLEIQSVYEGSCYYEQKTKRQGNHIEPQKMFAGCYQLLFVVEHINSIFRKQKKVGTLYTASKRISNVKFQNGWTKLSNCFVYTAEWGVGSLLNQKQSLLTSSLQYALAGLHLGAMLGEPDQIYVFYKRGARSVYLRMVPILFPLV